MPERAHVLRDGFGFQANVSLVDCRRQSRAIAHRTCRSLPIGKPKHFFRQASRKCDDCSLVRTPGHTCLFLIIPNGDNGTNKLLTARA